MLPYLSHSPRVLCYTSIIYLDSVDWLLDSVHCMQPDNKIHFKRDYRYTIALLRLQLVYEMLILLGAISGVALGNVTVKTPSFMLALTSLSCKHLNLRISTTIKDKTTNLYALRKLDRPGKLAALPLPECKPALIEVLGHFHLTRDGKAAVVHLDVDLVRRQTREFEQGRDAVIFRVLVEIHSAEPRE